MIRSVCSLHVLACMLPNTKSSCLVVLFITPLSGLRVPSLIDSSKISWTAAGEKMPATVSFKDLCCILCARLITGARMQTYTQSLL